MSERTYKFGEQVGKICKLLILIPIYVMLAVVDWIAQKLSTFFDWVHAQCETIAGKINSAIF